MVVTGKTNAFTQMKIMKSVNQEVKQRQCHPLATKMYQLNMSLQAMNAKHELVNYS
jgi:hypothetical protein